MSPGSRATPEFHPRDEATTGLGADVAVQGGNGMIKVLKKKSSYRPVMHLVEFEGPGSQLEQVPVMWQRGNVAAQ